MICRNLCTFLIFLLCLTTQFLLSLFFFFFLCSLFFVYFLCLLICLEPFLASDVSCIIPFFFSFLLFFFTNLLSLASFAFSYVLFVSAGIISFFDLKFQFLYLQHVSCLRTFVFHFVYCPLLSGFCSFTLCMVLRLSKCEGFFFFILIQREGLIFLTLKRSNWSGFRLGIFFRLINFLFISTLALTIL